LEKNLKEKMIKNKYLQHRETVHNFLWRSLQVGGKQGIIFAIFFMSAYFLTPFDFGIFNYLMAIVVLLLIFCDFGVSSSTSKYVAEYNTKNPKKVRSILFSVSLIIFLFAFIVSIFIIIFGKTIFNENYKYLIYFLPYLFLAPLSSVADGFYRGLKEFKKLSIITLSTGFVSLWISYFLIKKYLLIGAILSQNILLLLLVFSLFFFKRDLEFKMDKKILKKIINYGLVIGLANVGFFMYSKADVLILKQFGYIVEIGYYEIINKFFQMLFIPTVILGTVIAPNITKHISKKNYFLIKEKLKKYLFIILPLSTLLSIALFFFFPIILKIIFPKYYSTEFLYILNILLILLPFKLWGVFCTNGFITPGGFAKIITITTLSGGILNVIFDYLFISQFGFIAVFLVTLVIHSLNISIQFIYLYWRINNEIEKNR